MTELEPIDIDEIKFEEIAPGFIVGKGRPGRAKLTKAFVEEIVAREESEYFKKAIREIYERDQRLSVPEDELGVVGDNISMSTHTKTKEPFINKVKVVLRRIFP